MKMPCPILIGYEVAILSVAFRDLKTRHLICVQRSSTRTETLHIYEKNDPSSVTVIFNAAETASVRLAHQSNNPHFMQLLHQVLGAH